MSVAIFFTCQGANVEKLCHKFHFSGKLSEMPCHVPPKLPQIHKTTNSFKNRFAKTPTNNHKVFTFETILIGN